MDHNEIAKKLAALGKQERAALNRLNRIANERCALLTEVVESGTAGLSPATAEEVIEPKEDEPTGP